MKASRFVMIICVVLSAVFYSGYCEDNDSSGIIVFGSSEKSSSASQGVIETDNTQTSGLDGSGETPNTVLKFYEITGDRIGGTYVSQPVTLPRDGKILFVDAGMSGAFTIVQVNKDGKETQVLNVNPQQAVGKILPTGTYKVYPEDLDGKFTLEKLTAKVQVGLVETPVGGAQ